MLALTLLVLEIQADFTSTFCKGSHSSMVGIATTIKDDTGDTFFFCTPSNEFPDLASNGYFAIVLNPFECLNGRFPGTFLSLG